MKLSTAHILAVMTLSWTTLVVANPAIAQTGSELVGTWRPVSVVNTRPDGSITYPLGPNPKGILVFTSNGRFAFILNRADLPKFESNNRNTGTAEENRAIVQGSLAYFGTYSVTNKVVMMHVEGRDVAELDRHPTGTSYRLVFR